MKIAKKKDIVLFKAHIKKHCVIGGGDILDELIASRKLIRKLKHDKIHLRTYLSAFVNGAAIDKETGLRWQHWIDEAKKECNI